MLKKISLLLALLLLIPTAAYGAGSSAVAAIVMDANTGEILFEKNIYSELSMASTTKIMTSLIACESGRLDETVTVSGEMLNSVGTSLGLGEGSKITLYDLVVGMLLASGNDAANAVAVYLGGSLEGFAAMMNEKARTLGMEDSLFVTPSGLDEGNHHSTALDMAILTAAALKNDIFSEICSQKSMAVSISGKKQTLYNHNKLLSFMDDCVGVKTGYTSKAGRCLVSAVKRNGNTLICVTLNDADDWNDHMALYDECAKMYSVKEMKSTVNIPVVGAVKTYAAASYSISVSVLNTNHLTVEYYYFPFIYAPVNKGDEIGKAVIKYKEKEIASAPLAAEESIEYYVKQE